MGIAWECF
jgi:hypothetical protein